jgi:hypothetical protein
MVLNVILTCWFWLPGVRHALVVYADWKVEHAHQEMMTAVHAPRWARVLHQPQQQPQQVFYLQQPEAAKPARRKKPQAVEQFVDDPCVGMRGTVFPRRS